MSRVDHASLDCNIHLPLLTLTVDCCVQIAEELPPDILQEYKDIFSYFDRDGGGSIGAEEFDQVMRTFGWEPKDEELKEMVSVIDQDGDGTISFNEFVWLMTR